MLISNTYNVKPYQPQCDRRLAINKSEILLIFYYVINSMTKFLATDVRLTMKVHTINKKLCT